MFAGTHRVYPMPQPDEVALTRGIMANIMKTGKPVCPKCHEELSKNEIVTHIQRHINEALREGFTRPEK